MLSDFQKNLINLVLCHCLAVLLGPTLTHYLVKIGDLPSGSEASPDPHDALNVLIVKSKNGKAVFPPGTMKACKQARKLYASKDSRAAVFHVKSSRWFKWEQFLSQWAELCFSCKNQSSGRKIRRLHGLLKAEVDRLSQPGATISTSTSSLLMEMVQTSFEEEPESLDEQLARMAISSQLVTSTTQKAQTGGPSTSAASNNRQPRLHRPLPQKAMHTALNATATAGAGHVPGPYRPNSTFPPRKVPY
jgi:hypothetical protein